MPNDWETRWADEPKATDASKATDEPKATDASKATDEPKAADAPKAKQPDEKPAAASTPPLPASSTETIVFPAITTYRNRLDDFVYIKDVASTEMGQVLQYRHKKLDKLVAIKFLSMARLNSELDRARLEFEGRIISNLEHENIVKTIDCFEHKRAPALVLEWVSGGTLQDLVMARGQLPWKEALKHLITLAEAMQYAHGERVIHRDLKPNNVLVTSTGKLKITDFGLGMVQGNTLNSQLPAGAGTVAWMAPEQAHSPEKVNHLADQFALGAIGYFLLTGKAIRSSDDNVTRDATLLPPMELQWPAKLPEEFRAILLRCLQSEPGARYRNTADLVKDLHDFRDGKPIAAWPVGVFRRFGKLVWRNALTSSLVSLVFAIVLVSVVWLAVLYRENQIEKNNVTAVLQQGVGMLRAAYAASNSEAGVFSNTKLFKLRLQLHVLEQYLIYLQQPSAVDREEVLQIIIDTGATLWELELQDEARQCLAMIQRLGLVKEAAKLSRVALNRWIYYQALCDVEPGFQLLGLLQARDEQADIIRDVRDKEASDELVMRHYLQTACALGHFYHGLHQDVEAGDVYLAAWKLLETTRSDSPELRLLKARVLVEGARSFLADNDRAELTLWVPSGNAFFEQERQDESRLIGQTGYTVEWDICHVRYLSFRSGPVAFQKLNELERLLRQKKYVDLTYPQRETLLAETLLFHAQFLLRRYGLDTDAETLLDQCEDQLERIPVPLQVEWLGRLLLMRLELDAMRQQPESALQHMRQYHAEACSSPEKAMVLLLLCRMIPHASSEVQLEMNQACSKLCETLPPELTGPAALTATAIPERFLAQWDWHFTIPASDQSSETMIALYWTALRRDSSQSFEDSNVSPRLQQTVEYLNALTMKDKQTMLRLLRAERLYDDDLQHQLFLRLCEETGHPPYQSSSPP